MRRTGALAVTAAALLALSACGSSDPATPAAAAPSSTEPAAPNAEQLVDLPPQLVVPEAFDATAGFALRTGNNVQGPEGQGRDTFELTEFGVATYVAEPGQVPVLESTTLTGVSQWRAEVTDPLTPDPNPRLQPSLRSVPAEDRTWLAVVEYGSEPGSSELVTRLTTFDAETGELGVRSSLAGAQPFISKGGNLVFQVYRDPAAAESPVPVFIDPETGEQTRRELVRAQNETSGWEDLVLDRYQGRDVILRQCVGGTGYRHGACPDGSISMFFDGQLVPHSNEDAATTVGLTVTPAGTILGYRNLTTGKDFATTCKGSETSVWSPSGRHAVIGGNVVDFELGTSSCLGYYPQVWAIDDQAVGYGRMDNEDQVSIDLTTGVTTVLPAGTLLPSGIGAGGYGVFRTDTAVVVLPPR